MERQSTTLCTFVLFLAIPAMGTAQSSLALAAEPRQAVNPNQLMEQKRPSWQVIPQTSGKTFGPNQLMEMKQIGTMIVQGRPLHEIQPIWKSFVERSRGSDTDTAIQHVLEEAKGEAKRNVQRAIEKQAGYQALKGAIRNELHSIRDLLFRATQGKVELRPKVFGVSAGKVVIKEANYLISKRADIEAYAEALGRQLSSLSDDAQMANIDLQNMLQRQQQVLQMLATMEKMLHDTASAIIRKLD